MPKINRLSSRIKGVEGVFELRGVPIPAINLAVALGDENAAIHPDQQIIVTEFSMKRAGFIVSQTHRIRRVAWNKVLPPASDASSCINGMTLNENNEFLFILDLERILSDIDSKNDSSKQAAINNKLAADMISVGEFRQNLPGQRAMPVLQQSASTVSSTPSGPAASQQVPCILLVDDSNFILASAKKALEAVGFRVLPASDGAQAKNMLQQMINGDRSIPKIDAVVSDVEMPRLDGLTLTKWIKENPSLQDIPVILHTSLSGKANQEAGISVGANGYVVKNDIRHLLHLLSEIIGYIPQPNVVA
jgi:two-component system chemotaxis response regulator CheV